MQYRSDKYGNKLSALGFGCMRLPRGLLGIDYDKSEKLICEAVEQGVNYFDTAYIYGGSEEILGEILHRNNCREEIYIATKLPILKVKSHEDFDRLFKIQLDRLKTDHIDYYLVHNVSTIEEWCNLEDLGIVSWLAEKKSRGDISQAGFSFHGTRDTFGKLLDVFDWDFTQIQYNYMNENYQAGRAGLHAAAEKGLPVIIMEPLLGGKLANGVPKKGIEILKRTNADYSPAAWAMRWLLNQPEVTVILSGMNAHDQLRDNIKTASQSAAGCLSDRESAAIEAVKAVFKESYKIPCTGCNYCMPCPKGVNIPGIFASYNASFANGFVTGMMQYITGTGASSRDRNQTARSCVKCGKCESHCPQNIAISKELETVTRRMEPFWFGTAMKAVNRFMQGKDSPTR